MTAARGDWLALLRAISAPILAHGAAGTLRSTLPVATAPGEGGRQIFAHLEAGCRTLAGIAPWLELAGLEGEEAEAQSETRGQARALVASITDPASPDHIDFGEEMQTLVEAAFLAQAILRAPTILWNDMPAAVRTNIIREMAATRGITPTENNWLLFPAMIETLFAVLGLDFDRARIDRAIRQFDAWYVGDGWYGDGPVFHFDYYNSFVIHPFLLDIVRVRPGEAEWQDFAARHIVRAQRHAVQLERMIGADGAMPAIGRSLAYRCGNLHLPAQLALLHGLPPALGPGAAREAMRRAIEASLSVPGTFDDAGWLTIGCRGNQPGLGERYITTGSVYLCTAAFLPLGLSADDPFWTAPGEPTTSEMLGRGGNIPPDIALWG